MKIPKYIILCVCACLFLSVSAHASGGSGEVSVSYLYLDEEGNQAVNHPAFNLYEGFGISLENFRYLLDNGIRFDADFKNIILNNRNLSLGVEKSGLFGIRLNHNQYRRIYDFEGASYTRRHVEGGRVWLNPQRYLKLWGGAKNTGRSGKVADLFGPDPAAFPIDVDYGQFEYNGGFRVNYLGRVFWAEYRRSDFSDELDSSRDQSRQTFRINALIPVPKWEWLILSGGFRRFESWHDLSKFEISSNRVWGGFLADLPENFQLRYHFIFDRASSDSDFVATDNLAHAVYLSHLWPRLAQLMVGYQHDINDDFEDEVGADSYSISGWIKPSVAFEFRAEYGLREEEVKEGARLIGDEDRSRLRLTGKYRHQSYGSLSLKFEDRVRENADLDTRIDFKRFAADYSLTLDKYGILSGGYALSNGDYNNRDEDFEFTDHTLYGDINLNEYHKFTPAFGLTYYRSKRDLDVESFILRFKLAYRFYRDYRIEIRYDVHNFDDFLFIDKYYTANIVEINLIKNISF